MLRSYVRPPRPPHSSLAGVVGAAIAGALFFAWVAGPRLLDPADVDWLMKGDWVPHYFGWHFFRHEPWGWPPGVVRGYYAPLGTSVGLTDSIPLAAYLLKPLDALLPFWFQYLGPWLLLCFALQGALVARLIGRASPSPWVQILGGMLAVLLPTLLVRVGHAALCAHWLVLWALLIATDRSERRLLWWRWSTIGLVAGMVQPYLAAMVLALLGATAVGGNDAPVGRRVTALASGTGAMLAGWWLSGLFILGGDRSLSEGGLGYFSMNLLSFVNPSGWSRWMPDLPFASPGQTYEGFHYLGLGVLALAVVAVVLAVATRGRGDGPAASTPSPLVLGVCLAMAAFALSPTVTLGSRVIVDLNGPWSAPLAMFRSSGRFVWPLTYVGLVWAVVTVARRLPPRPAVAVLAGAVALQFADLHAAHVQRHDSARDPAFHDWTRRFTSDRWNAIAPEYADLVLVPPPQCGASPIPYEPAVRLAATYGLTVNAGVVARADTAARARYCADADADIDAVRLRDDALYVVSESAAAILARQGGDRVACGRIDTVWICTTAAAHLRWPAAASFDEPAAP
ncbi:MAG: DUF6311 domain-containing protein [Vicinamibacterales bacterium]